MNAPAIMVATPPGAGGPAASAGDPIGAAAETEAAAVFAGLLTAAVAGAEAAGGPTTPLALAPENIVEGNGDEPEAVAARPDDEAETDETLVPGEPSVRVTTQPSPALDASQADGAAFRVRLHAAPEARATTAVATPSDTGEHVVTGDHVDTPSTGEPAALARATDSPTTDGQATDALTTDAPTPAGQPVAAAAVASPGTPEAAADTPDIVAPPVGRDGTSPATTASSTAPTGPTTAPTGPTTAPTGPATAPTDGPSAPADPPTIQIPTANDSPAGADGAADTSVAEAAAAPASPLTKADRAELSGTVTGTGTTRHAAPAPPANQLASAVAAMRRRGEGEYTASLDLHPAELGRVQVDVEIRAGVVNVHVNAEQSATRALLTAQLDDLRSALTQGGLDAGQLDVSQQGWSDRSRDDGDDTPDHTDQPASTAAIESHDSVTPTTVIVPASGLDVRL